MARFRATTFEINGGKWGLIDVHRNHITEVIYDDIEDVGAFFELIPVKKDNKVGFVNRTGTSITSLKYDDVEYKNDEDV